MMKKIRRGMLMLVSAAMCACMLFVNASAEEEPAEEAGEEVIEVTEEEEPAEYESADEDEAAVPEETVPEMDADVTSVENAVHENGEAETSLTLYLGRFESPYRPYLIDCAAKQGGSMTVDGVVFTDFREGVMPEDMTDELYPVDMNVDYSAYEGEFTANVLQAKVKKLVESTLPENKYFENDVPMYFCTIGKKMQGSYALHGVTRNEILAEMDEERPLLEHNELYTIWNERYSHFGDVQLGEQHVCGQTVTPDYLFRIFTDGERTTIEKAQRDDSGIFREVCGYVKDRTFNIEDKEHELNWIYPEFEGGSTYTIGMVLEPEIGYYFDEETIPTMTISDEVKEIQFIDLEHIVAFAEVTVDHDWDLGTVIKEASETEDGLIEYQCRHCGEKKEEIIPHGDLVITKQPEDAQVVCPEGATFSVSVNRLEQIASYQWYLIDNADQVFKLDGTTANSPELVIPSTFRPGGRVERYYCVVTSVDGEEIQSRVAGLSINEMEEKNVLYVCDRALLPGESVDLSEIGMGSGTITYETNETDVTLDHVNFVENPSTTKANVPVNGLWLDFPASEAEDFHIHLIGANRIQLTYCDENKVGGTAIAADFKKDWETNLYIDGEGSLTFVDCGICAITPGYLYVDSDLTMKTPSGWNSIGLEPYGLIVRNGAAINADISRSFGTVSAFTQITDGAVVNIREVPVSNIIGWVDTTVFTPFSGLLIDNAKLNITSSIDSFDPEWEGVNGYTGIQTDRLEITGNGELNLRMKVAEAGPDEPSVTCGMMKGIELGNPEFGAIIHDGGSLNIDIDGPMRDCIALDSMGYIAVRDSDVAIRGRSMNNMIGIQAQDEFEATDSNIAVSLTSDSPQTTVGIRSFGAHFSESDENTSVTVRTDGGTALMVGTDLHFPYEPKFDPDYIPSATVIDPSTGIISPRGALISSMGMYNPDEQGYRLIEALYDRSGQIASDMVIAHRR